MNTTNAASVSENEREIIEEESASATIAAQGVKALMGGPIPEFLRRDIWKANALARSVPQLPPRKLGRNASHLEEGLLEIVEVLEESPKEFFSGTIAGMAGIIAGHPLDLLKTRAQTDPRLTSNVLSSIRKIVVHEGFAGLFKGMGIPLLTVAVQNAIVFGVYGTSLKVMQSVSNNDLNSEAPLSLVFSAGALSGLANTIVVSPAELVKVQLQVQESRRNQERYKSMLHCCKELYKCGGIRELARGFTPTLLREIPSGGIYFATYEYFKRLWGESHWSILTAGGLGGVAAWILMYPVDVVKSNCQSFPPVPRDQRTPGERVYPGMIECTRDLYKRGGVPVFFKGVGICAVRGFWVNAIIFLVQEKVSRFCNEVW